MAVGSFAVTADQFGHLVIRVVEDPAAVNHSELLAAAAAYRDATPESDDAGKELSRRLAFAAMDLAVFYSAAEYAALRRITLAFQQLA